MRETKFRAGYPDAGDEAFAELKPSFSIVEFAKVFPFKDPEEADRVVRGMRQEGLPE